MTSTPLFRPAAMNASRADWLGDIVLVRPLSFLALTMAAVAMSLMIACFLFFGSYTKRSTVLGQIVPDAGVLKVFAPQAGVVIKKFVREGQRVTKGDILYLTSSERQSSTRDEVQATISRQVAFREQSLRDELRHTLRLQQDEERALRKKIEGLRAEQTNLLSQSAGQRVRVQLAEEAVERAAHLRTQGYISTEMWQQKQADLLDQNNRLQALKRDEISVGRELEAQSSELTSLPLRHRTQLAQIERLITSSGQEWTESEGKRRAAISAPESGIATAVSVEVGQGVDGTKPLLSIIPNNSQLQASLFAPSRAIGFVRPGDKVLLRYQAYPYQKFGHAHGVVATVSRIAQATSELTGSAVSFGSNGEPLYQITVLLTRQTITAYGHDLPLQAGMLVDADICHEQRKLFEWVLEPLYSLTGKL